ncbi:hypothetical protein GUI12_04565 [Anaplasmataceae bacterium AB001_6]|nr:hypothetical protein GUI12_04565 [Anaplasmataceae bacterium AB001_6]
MFSQNELSDLIDNLNPVFLFKIVENPLLMKIVLAKLTILIVIQYSKKYQIDSIVLYFMISALIGSCLMISFDHLLYILISLELVSFSSYIMVSIRNKGNKLLPEATLKYFVLGSISSCMMLYGISLLYIYSDSLYLTDLIREINANKESLFLNFALALFFIGLIFKIGTFPYHNWMADLYQGAHPFAVSFVSTIPKIMIIYFLSRLTILHMESKIMAYILCILGCLSMFFGTFSAIKQDDIRRIVAYGTTSQIGYILICISLSLLYSSFSNANITYAICYSICMIGIFSIMMQIIKGHETSELSCLCKNNPIIAISLVLLILSISGIPPMPVFLSKLMLMKDIALITNTNGILSFGIVMIIAIMTFSVISMLYYFNIIKNIYFYMDSRTSSKMVFMRSFTCNLVLTIIIFSILFYTIVPIAKIDIVQTIEKIL